VCAFCVGKDCGVGEDYQEFEEAIREMRTWPEDFINKIICGDCLEVMKEMPDKSIDAIVTDPPYGLEFMGKDWDKLWDKRNPENNKDWYDPRSGGFQKKNPISFRGKNPNYKAGLEAQLWHTQWLTEAFRVLKPGGSMLVMGGTRTFHRLMVAIEDSGFIIKDTLAWNYGSGFPKAQDFSRATLKKFLREWLGDVDHFRYKDGGFQFDCPHNCHLCDELFQFFQVNDKDGEHKQGDAQEYNRPSEPLAKTLSDILCKYKASYASLFCHPSKQDYLFHIVSSDGQLSQEEFSDLCQLYSEQLKQAGSDRAISQAYKDSSNVDVLSCEFVLEKFEKFCHNYDISQLPSYKYCNRINQFIQAKLLKGHKIGGLKPAWEPIVYAVKPPEGSYIDNVLKWGIGAVNMDECRIETEYKQDRITNSNQSIYGGNALLKSKTIQTTSRDGNSKGRFPANVILDEEAGRVMDEMSGSAGQKVKPGYIRKSEKTKNTYGKYKFNPNEIDYTDNGGASRFFYCAKASKSERGENNKHPTVKPIALFEWLIKLVTREGQIVLDPFLGSGTTAEACKPLYRDFIGIEKNPDYCKIAEERLAQGVL